MFGREKGMASSGQIATTLGHEGVPVAPGTVGAIMKKRGGDGEPKTGRSLKHYFRTLLTPTVMVARSPAVTPE